MCALIPAAGRGARFGDHDAAGLAQNKVFTPLCKSPLLGWTIRAFADCDVVDQIVLIGAETDLPRLRQIGEQYGGGKVRAVVAGGANRQESVRQGLAVCPSAEWIIVHDAARPAVTPELIRATLIAAQNSSDGAASAAIPVTDTLIRQDATRQDAVRRDATPVSRDDLFAVQTPQVFAAPLLRAAHESAHRDNIVATDDAALVRRLGKNVLLTPGAPENLKVTRPDDLALAETILAERAGAFHSPFRIGHGYDVHPFAPPGSGRALVLGGVHFPEAEHGLLGHSDADVVLHAVCDALLGATGLGDIGVFFPPSDAAHKDRDSREFLRIVFQQVRHAGWQIANVDITVLAEAPKISPRAPQMRAQIAEILRIPAEQVGVKATTNEKMGFVGRGEGIAAHAVALLFKN